MVVYDDTRTSRYNKFLIYFGSIKGIYVTLRCDNYFFSHGRVQKVRINKLLYLLFERD